MAFESMTNELANKSATGRLDMQSRIENSNNALNAWNSTVDTVNLGMETYAQNRWNKDEPDIKNDLYRLGDDYLDVNDEDSYGKYMDAVDNYINQKASGYGPLMKSYLLNHKTELVNYAKEKYQPRIDQQIAIANHNAFTEIEEKLVNKVSNNDWDFGSLGNPEMYKFSADSNGKIVRQKVEVEGLYEVNDDMPEQERNWHSFLNAMLVAKCGDNCTMEEAKAYVQNKEDEWEYAVMSNDMTYLTKNAIDGKIDGINIQTEQQVVDYLETIYSKDGYKPYSRKKITPAEEEVFKKSAISLVQTEWKTRENEAYGKFEQAVMPEFERLQDSGQYITSDIFDGMCADAGIDSRFIKSTRAEYQSILDRNDAMYELQTFFNAQGILLKGNNRFGIRPQDSILSVNAREFLDYNDITGLYTYSDNAGFYTIGGQRQVFFQNQTNLEIYNQAKSKGEKMISDFVSLYNDLSDFRNGVPKDGNSVQAELENRLSLLGDGRTAEQEEQVRNELDYEMEMKAWGLFYNGKQLGASTEIASKNVELYEGKSADERKIKDTAERNRKLTALEAENYSLDVEADILVASNIIIKDGMTANAGINMAMDRLVAGLYSEIGDDSALYGMSIDPLCKLPSNEYLHMMQSGKKPTKEWFDEYAKKYCESEQDIYDLYWQIGETLTREKYVKSGEMPTNESVITTLQGSYNDVMQTWIDDYYRRCEDYDNRLAVFNGTKNAYEQEDGTTIYTDIPNKSSSAKSTSTSGSGEQRYSNALSKYERYNENKGSSTVPVANGDYFLGAYIDNLGNVDIGKMRTIAETDPNLTPEERKMVLDMTTSEWGKKFFGDNARIESLKRKIDELSWDDSEKGRAWVSAVNYISRNYNENNNNLEDLISSWSSSYQETATNAFISAMTNLGFDGIDHIIGGNSKFNSYFMSYVKNTGKLRYDNEHTLYGVSDKVTNYLNGDIKDIKTIEEFSLFNGDTSIKDEDKFANAMKVAFKILGMDGMYNSETDLKQKIERWQSELYTEDGEPRYTDNADELRTKLYEAFLATGELLELSDCFIELSNADYNLGLPRYIDRNVVTMSSGVRVQIGYDEDGKRKMNVLNKDNVAGDSYDMFASKKVIEEANKAISDQVNSDNGVFSQGMILQTQGFGDLVDGEIKVMSGEPEGTNQRRYNEAVYQMKSLGNQLVGGYDWSQLPKFSNGQFDAEWANEYGYQPPELYSGTSINGHTFNYVMTTNSEQDFSDRLLEFRYEHSSFPMIHAFADWLQKNMSARTVEDEQRDYDIINNSGYPF